ncbi:MAG TPA: glycosyltransferase family 9 protein [Candidatus Polarisedimenticolia bacterium]|nr:glycosyltransferase family 9 protein [Candidatus Polarisedimenticolia bacterium]
MTPAGARTQRPGGEIRRIAVLRALRLGDMLCAVPALRALRRRFPQARILLLGLPWAVDFVQRFPRYLDELIPLPGFPGLPETPPDEAAFERFAASLRDRRLDLALQLHGDGSITNAVVARLGAREVAGFHPMQAAHPGHGRFLPYPGHGHEIHRLLALTGFLGAPSEGDHLEWPIHAADRAEAHSVAGTVLAGDAPYVCLHPGARSPGRRWAPGCFAQVGDALSRRGFAVVLTGSEEERPLTAAVASGMASGCLDTAGRLSLGGMAAVLAGGRLLVCNDTGVSHLAAALRAPSVVVHLASDPARWAPLDRALHRPVAAAAPGTPCAHAGCSPAAPCSRAVDPGEVLEEAWRLLEGSPRGDAARTAS